MFHTCTHPSPLKSNKSQACTWDLSRMLSKRVMGFEPTTFCLGSRHSAN